MLGVPINKDSVSITAVISLPGTGKSFLLNQIINFLRSQYEEDFVSSVAICASTGIAATHIGGPPPHFLMFHSALHSSRC